MTRLTSLSRPLLAALIATVLGGCSSTGGSVSASAYYGVGWYDPWYYHRPYYGDNVIIVNPPPKPERPDRPEKPDRPIKPRPPVQTLPAHRPPPSIPTRPRPAARPMLRR